MRQLHFEMKRYTHKAKKLVNNWGGGCCVDKREKCDYNAWLEFR